VWVILTFVLSVTKVEQAHDTELKDGSRIMEANTKHLLEVKRKRGGRPPLLERRGSHAHKEKYFSAH